MGSAVERLVRLTRVYVRPHEQMREGKLVHVEGYTREFLPTVTSLRDAAEVAKGRFSGELKALGGTPRVNAKVRELLDDPKVRIAVSLPVEDLDGVLDRGRLIPGTDPEGSPGHKPYSESIAKLETKLWGTDAMHPTYGYLSANGAMVNRFGGASIVLKPDTKRRSSVFFGDSGQHSWEGAGAQGSKIAAQPWDEADYRSLDWSLTGNPMQFLAEAKTVDDIKPYVEAQVFGGVSTDDIERVVLPPLRTEAELDDAETMGIERELYDEQIAGVKIRRRLDEIGIPWSERPIRDEEVL